MFPVASYDPETLRLLTGAFEDAWRATQEMLGKKPLDRMVGCVGCRRLTWSDSHRDQQQRRPGDMMTNTHAQRGASIAPFSLEPVTPDAQCSPVFR